MFADFWPWLTQTDEGLLTRIAFGVVTFTILALLDLRRHGRASRRWREYMILLSAVGVALLYGVVNDQITSRISWEYFFFIKELCVKFDNVRPSDSVMQWEALKIGLKATWTVGLLFGVAVLFANNPRKSVPQLPDRQIYRMLPIPVLFAAVVAALLGAVTVLLPDLAIPLMPDMKGLAEKSRDVRLYCVWAIHFGGYVGATLGAIFVVLRILRQRRQQPPTTHADTRRQVPPDPRPSSLSPQEDDGV